MDPIGPNHFRRSLRRRFRGSQAATSPCSWRISSGGCGNMEKSSSTATQTAEPPASATSSLPAADQSSSPAMDLDSPQAFTPGASVQGQTFPTPEAATRPHLGAQVPAPPSDPSSRGRKRALEGNLQMENSNYYKMRLLVKDLRPHVLEVLGTPDFKNCKAATEIQEKMKLMLQLCREMIGETPKSENITKTESLSNGKAINQTPQGTTATTQTEKHSSVSVGDGDKVVGGSAFGWNFITYGGTAAVYCGLSKEEYRTSHPLIQAAEVEVELQNTS